MGRVVRRRRWVLVAALVAAVGAFVAVRIAGGPTPDPAAGSGGGGGEAPEALAADPARARGGEPASLDASGKPLPAPVAAAPTLPEASPAAAPATALRGIVVDEAGKPVSRAEVRGRDRAESEAALEGAVLPVLAVTDVDGRFTVAQSPARGARSVTVAAPGLSQRGSEAYMETGVETRIVMVPSCPLRVRVTEEGGDRPVPDALVHATTGSWVAAVFGHALDAPVAELVRTDAAGRATLPTEGGPAVLVVRPRTHAPVVISGITVPRVGTDVDVRVVPGGTLLVSVRGPDGAALPGARVGLDVRPAYRQHGVTEVEGRVRFEGLPSGISARDSDDGDPPVLIVAAPGLETQIVGIALPDSGAPLTQEVRMRPARWIRGTVRKVDGSAVPGVRVRAELRTGSSAMESACEPPAGVSHPDGSFALGPVTAGLWAVHALRTDGDPVTGVDVEVPEEGDPPPAELRMPSTDGRLTVLVVDAGGVGVAGARLEVRATRGMYRLAVAEGITDATGVARLVDLAPESAVLLLRPPGSAPMARDLTATDYDGRELRIVLGDGTIEGRVIGSDRRPRRVHVRIYGEIDGCIMDGATVVSDEGGAFGFTGLSPGTHRVNVDEADGVLVGGDVLLPVGARTLTLMVVTPAEAARLHVELRLVDGATGAPVTVPAFRSQAVLVSRLDAKEWHAPHGPDDGEGRFLSFESLPPGTYDGRLVVPGYVDVDLGVITLPAEGEVRMLRLNRSDPTGK